MLDAVSLSAAGLWHAAVPARGLTIGLIPEMNVFKQKKRFDPLARHLAKELGTPVRLTILSRYGNIVERFTREGLDAAFLGSFTGALSISQLGLEPLARPVNEDGTSTYFGYLFIHRGSGIKTVADMRGKTFAFVERATTAGYVFPLAYLRHNGVAAPMTFLGGYFFTGSHDAAIDSVISGRAQIGAAKNTIFDRLRAENPAIDRELKVIASSPRVPSNGLCVRPDMIAPMKERLRDALLTLDQDDAGRAVLRAMGVQRFVRTTVKDYQPVFDLAREAGIAIADYRYQNK